MGNFFVKRQLFDLEDERVNEFLLKEILKKKGKNSNIVFVFIGTSAIVGDTYAPLIGSFIKEIETPEKIFFYGNLEEQIHGMNVNDKAKFINEKHKDDVIIAVDACLGKRQNVNKIIIKNESLRPGLGLGKDCTCIGDISVMAIVGEHSEDIMTNSQRLRFVNFRDIYNLANYTFKSIKYVINNC